MTTLTPWLELFPKLKKWPESIGPDTVSVEFAPQHLEEISIEILDLMNVHSESPFWTSTIFSLFPRIGLFNSIDELEFENTTKNLLARLPENNLGYFLRLTPKRFSEIPTSSEAKTIAFIHALIKNSIRSAALPNSQGFGFEFEHEPNSQIKSSDPGIELKDPNKETLDEIGIAITRFAYFLHFQGEEHLQIFNYPRNFRRTTLEDYPRPIVNGKYWLKTFNIPTPTQIIENFEDSLIEEPNMVEVLHARLASSAPKSLDEIGSKLGKTRERIRQIEVKLKKRIEQFRREDEYFEHVINALRFLSRYPIQKDILISQAPYLNDETKTGIKVWNFVFGMNFLTEIDGWIFDDYQTRLAQTKEILERATRTKEIFDFTKAFKTIMPKGFWREMPEEQVAAWLHYLGYSTHESFAIKGTGVQRKSRLVLLKENKPMSTTEIVAQLGSNNALRTVDNALAGDPAFSRVTKSAWGLTEWGLDPYTTISDAIGRYIDEHGSVPLDQLVGVMTEKYDVKAGSVRSYASGVGFSIVNGYVKRSSVKRVSRKPVSKTKNVYITKSGIAFRIKISTEHLRGSGSACPSALAAWLGVEKGSKKSFKANHGDFTLSNVNNIANLSSVKSVCVDLGVNVGDYLILEFVDDSVEFKKVTEKLSADQQIREYCALPTSGSLMNQLAAALDLESTADREQIVKTLSSRKEEDVLGLILASSI